MISSIPVALNAIYMLMTYKFMSPVQKSLRVRLIYPPGYLTSLLGYLIGISKETCKNGNFHFPPKAGPFPEYPVSINEATMNALVQT